MSGHEKRYRSEEIAPLMAGGGVIYLNFVADQHKLSSIPFWNSEKDDGVQCSIPYGRWGCCLFEI